MRLYLLSLAAGLAVGVFYALIQVRSPAPPLIALVGLLGILIGEQVPPAMRGLLHGHPLHTLWQRPSKPPSVPVVSPPRNDG